MEFDIEPNDIVIPKICPALQIPFGTDSNYNVPSVDRIDNSKGYIKGNVQVLSRRANMMKNCASNEELIQFAKWIKENIKTKTDD